jgi:hypothetical protein
MSQLEALQSHIGSNFLQDPAPIHQAYHSHFNLVDLADRYWNAVEDHHHNHSWKSKKVITILCFAVINLWVYSVHQEYFSWRDFQAKVAKELMKK